MNNLLEQSLSFLLNLSLENYTQFVYAWASLGIVAGIAIYFFKLMPISGKIDNHTGYHFLGGVSWQLEPRLEIFAEYIHTFTELNGTLSLSGPDIESFEAEVRGDYEFGLVRAGMNVLF